MCSGCFSYVPHHPINLSCNLIWDLALLGKTTINNYRNVHSLRTCNGTRAKACLSWYCYKTPFCFLDPDLYTEPSSQMLLYLVSHSTWSVTPHLWQNSGIFSCMLLADAVKEPRIGYGPDKSKIKPRNLQRPHSWEASVTKRWIRTKAGFFLEAEG